MFTESPSFGMSFDFFTNIPKIATFVNWSERKTIFGEINFSSDSWDDPRVIHQEFILKILNRVIRYPWWIANYKMRISSLNSKRLKISYSGMMSGTPSRLLGKQLDYSKFIWDFIISRVLIKKNQDLDTLHYFSYF